jgi:short-subunit dehydrogenase
MISSLTKRNVAVITGGAGGVGQEIAKIFNHRRIPVIITSRTKEKAKSIAENLQANNISNSPVIGMELDFNSKYSIRKFCYGIEKNKYNPKYLINNAGALITSNINDVEKKHIDLLFNANTIGPIQITKEFLPNIIKQKGSVLFNSPPYLIDDKTIFLLPYMQSKLAQTTFMKSLAHSMPHGPLVASFWTDFPLATDAIIKRGIGTRDQCVKAEIMGTTVEYMIWNSERNDVHGKEIVDAEFLPQMGIDPAWFKISEENTEKLTSLFLSRFNNKALQIA